MTFESTPEDRPPRDEAPAASHDRYRVAKLIIGRAVIAVGTAIVTLAVTKRVAQQENFNAYINGRFDGMSMGGYLDGWADAVESRT